MTFTGLLCFFPGDHFWHKRNVFNPFISKDDNSDTFFPLILAPTRFPSLSITKTKSSLVCNCSFLTNEYEKSELNSFIKPLIHSFSPAYDGISSRNWYLYTNNEVYLSYAGIDLPTPHDWTIIKESMMNKKLLCDRRPRPIHPVTIIGIHIWQF